MVDYHPGAVRRRRPPTVLAASIVQFFLSLLTLTGAAFAAAELVDGTGPVHTRYGLFLLGCLVAGVLFIAFGVGVLLGSNGVRIATLILDVIFMAFVLLVLIMLVLAVSDGSGPAGLQAMVLAFLMLIEGVTGLAVIMLTRSSAIAYAGR
jgi:hypothetical protein